MTCVVQSHGWSVPVTVLTPGDDVGVSVMTVDVEDVNIETVEERLQTRVVGPLDKLVPPQDGVPPSDEWLQARRGGIGGSDTASVLGIGEWRSAFEVYLDKVGEHPTPSVEENEAMEWGRLLEPAVLAKTARAYGVEIFKPRFMYQHRDENLGFMLDNPDGIVLDPDLGLDNLGVYEGKTCGDWMAERWGDAEDEPATYALMQTVHGASVLGLKWGIVGVLIGGNRFRKYRFEIDAELQTMLETYELDFWNRVETCTPPSPTGMDSDTRLLNKLWDPTTLEGRKIIVGDEAVDLVHRYNTAHAEVKTWQDEKDATANQLRLLMGDATEAVTVSDEKVCTWKPQQSTVSDQEKWEREIPQWFIDRYRTHRTIRVLRPSKKI